MSDPLSMIASITGIVGVSIEITKTLTCFISSVKSAPKEASQLTTEVSALHNVLEALTLVLEADNFKNDTFDEESILYSIIVACEENIALINVKTTKLRNASKIAGISLARLVWPFKREECLEIIQTLHRYVQTLQVLLISSNRTLLIETSTTVMEKLEEQHKSITHAIMDLAESSGAIMNKIAVGVEKVQSILEDVELEKVIQSLSPLEPHKRHQDIKSKRLNDSGKWFLDTPEFTTWCDGDRTVKGFSSILGGYGIPGAGKSVMSSLVIDYLSEKYSSHRSQVCLAYVYCDYRDEENQTAVHLIGALLKQILTRNSRHLSQEFVDSLRKQKKDTGAGSLDIATAGQLLRDALQHFERFYVCIDALDECKEEHRKDLVAAIKPLLEHSEISAHIFVTGRSYMQSQVEKALPILPLRIIIRASEDDIRRYVARQLEKDENYDDVCEEFRNEIMEKIVNTADGMFLLPALQIQSVLEQTSIADRKAALDKMPEKLDAAFQITIDRIERQAPAKAKLGMRVLKWTFLALRQLKTIELRHALAAIDCTSDTLDLDALPFEKSITECCYGLVIIDKETSSIRLVHKSLHDYLKQQYEAGKIFMDGHREIARTCLKYMGIRIDRKDWDPAKVSDTMQCLIFGTGGEQKQKALAETGYNSPLLDKYPFLSYTIRFWGEHIMDKTDQELTDLAKSFLFVDNQNPHIARYLCAALFSVYGQHSYDELIENHDSALHLAAYFGLSRLAEDLLSIDTVRLDWPIGRSTPLTVAIARGYKSIVDMLIAAYAKKGIDLEHRHPGRSPLYIAVTHGRDDIVLALLNNGADVNCIVGKHKKTLLYYVQDIISRRTAGEKVIYPKVALEHLKGIKKLLIERGGKRDI